VRSVEVISLVYKSKEWTKFITDQMNEYNYAEHWVVQNRVVANDPEVDGLLNYPREHGVGVSLYNDSDPSDYYLNRVYRCWNWAAKTSPCDTICFVNSDMAFTPGWLGNLLKHHTGTNIPTSRLVESGKIPSGMHALVRDFGKTPKDFDNTAWQTYAATQSTKNGSRRGGLYMPVVFKKDFFLTMGGYPEGNLYEDGVGTCNGEVKASGDAFFFHSLQKNKGMQHVTVFDSLVYHVQEGEMDS
jgi:hypothetical protein